MAALNFPTSPTNGQVYTANGQTYVYNGTAWINQTGYLNNTILIQAQALFSIQFGAI